MSSPTTTAYTVLRPAPNPEPLRGHIGDLPRDVLSRVLYKLAWNDLLGFHAFVVATPMLAHDALRQQELLNRCGVGMHTQAWHDDVEFWSKFRQLRRNQRG